MSVQVATNSYTATVMSETVAVSLNTTQYPLADNTPTDLVGLLTADGKTVNVISPVNGKFVSVSGGAFVLVDAPTSLPSQAGQGGKFLYTDGTAASWAAVVGMAIGNSVGSGTAGRVLFVGVGGVLSQSAALQVGTGGLGFVGSDDVFLSLGPGGRRYNFGTYDLGGSFEFVRSDTGTGMYISPAAGVTTLGPRIATSLAVVTPDGGSIRFLSSPGGGAGLIQFGRRDDSHPAVGAAVQLWTSSGQVAPAAAVMAPGGGSYSLELRPNGSLRLAAMADSAAENDTWYYSTTSSKPTYKDSGGTAHALY